MEPLGHNTIRFRHLGDLREHGAFLVRLGNACAAARGRLQLLGTRSFIAPRSSSVNPSNFFSVAVVLLADFCSSFIAGFLPCES
jgi:hypothetical protein